MSSGELVLAAPEGFHGLRDGGVFASEGEENAADADTRAEAIGLTEGSSHAGLETIRAGAGKHLVDTEDVPRVDSAAQVEGVLADLFDHVLVDGNSASFEGL